MSLLKGTSAEAIARGILALVGYTFLLVGGLTLANELLVTSDRANLEAQVCTSSVDCNTGSTIEPTAEPETSTTETTSPTNTVTDPTIAPATTEITPNTVTVTQPTVRFYEVPTVTVIGRDTPIAITLLAAHNPKLYLVSPTHGSRTEVVHQRAVENRLYYTLPTATASPGEYYVLVVVTAIDGNAIANFTGPRFVVPKPPINESVVTTTTNTTEPTATTAVVPETTNSPIATSTSTTTVTTNPLILKARLGATSNTFQILTEGGGVYNRVELYLRNTSSTGRTFLGLATKTTTGYVYWLDASTVPVGTYVVIAQAKRDGVIIDTTETKITTTAPVPTITETTTREAEESIIKTNLTAEASVPSQPDILSVRQDYTTTILPTPTPTAPRPTTTTATPTPVALPPADNMPMQERARELLLERKDRLNELFIRQASAIQTGDVTVNKLAEEAIEAELKTIGEGADSNTKAEIERAAKVEIEKIKEKIVVTENILKARTKDKSTLDTDKDGISDYDELTIYKTNAKDSDTDRDGVLDSIEIMRGFNPNDATTEAVINFASPKELRYTNESVLKVENVVPVLSHTDETQTPTVHSEIRGFALPNSFVTLYIYSTPTVVTLRTNSDGSFAYVFEKELEDGEHEVYVALTDNTGDIVVQSNSFSFVKTAQAFTYEDESVALVENAQIPAVAPETSQTFMITIIMSIVAMGLILILLGQMLRTKRSDELTL